MTDGSDTTAVSNAQLGGAVAGSAAICNSKATSVRTYDRGVPAAAGGFALVNGRELGRENRRHWLQAVATLPHRRFIGGLVEWQVPLTWERWASG